MSDAFDGLLAELRRFTRERDWAQFHDPKNLSMLVASEAGELLHLFRWVRTEEADAFAARPENKAAIEEEVADTAIAVLLLADRLGVDLGAAIREKIAKNGRKYPPPARGLDPVKWTPTERQIRCPTWTKSQRRYHGVRGGPSLTSSMEDPTCCPAIARPRLQV